jgi:AraC family transcriptional regulator
MVTSAMGSTLPAREALERDYETRVRTLVSYIDQHLDEPLKLEELARRTCFSPYHLHRIFTAFVGMPMGEYIRRQRLGRAVLQLNRTRLPVTHIAFEAGYDSLAAFSKAFHQAFGRRPSEVRRERLVHLPFRNTKSISRWRKKMKPEIRTNPDWKIVSVTAKGFFNNMFNQAADESFTKLCAYMDKHDLWKYERGCLGLCPDEPSTTPPAECRYIGAFILADEARVEPEGEVELGKIPGGRFAVFTCKGPYEGLTSFWSSVYREWLPASGEKPRDAEPFEVYLNDKTKVKPQDLRTEIFIPIQ